MLYNLQDIRKEMMAKDMETKAETKKGKKMSENSECI